MNRLLCSIALISFACVAGAQPAGGGRSGKTFAGHEVGAAIVQPAGGLSLNDAPADSVRGPDSRVATGVTPAIPEPQTHALLLAGLGAIVFLAVRRRP